MSYIIKGTVLGFTNIWVGFFILHLFEDTWATKPTMLTMFFIGVAAIVLIVAGLMKEDEKNLRRVYNLDAKDFEE